MLLYHYCSNDTFLSILRNSELWLSELTLSNDSMEGAWVREVLLEECRKRKFPPDALNDISEKIRSLLDSQGAFGFCLSAEGDLLSQWRGYADNGAGIAIGFDSEALRALCKRSKFDASQDLWEIIYKKKEQRKILERFIIKLYELVENGAHTIKTDITSQQIHSEDFAEISTGHSYLLKFAIMANFFFKLKNHAFSEEKEHRILTIFSHYSQEKLSYTDKYNHLYEYMNFRTRGNHIVPYLPLPFPKKGCIKKIILGPRNRTPEPVIRAALEKYGFHNVDIKPSKATYR